MNAHAAIRRNHSHGKRELGARTSSIRLAALEDGVLDEMLGRAGDAIATGIATEILRHPVLAKIPHRTLIAVVPGRMWTCAGPGNIDAITLLNNIANEVRREDTRE